MTESSRAQRPQKNFPANTGIANSKTSDQGNINTYYYKYHRLWILFVAL